MFSEATPFVIHGKFNSRGLQETLSKSGQLIARKDYVSPKHPRRFIAGNSGAQTKELIRKVV